MKPKPKPPSTYFEYEYHLQCGHKIYTKSHLKNACGWPRRPKRRLRTMWVKKMPMQSSLPLPPIEASTFETCAEIPCANSPIYRQDSGASIWVRYMISTWSLAAKAQVAEHDEVPNYAFLLIKIVAHNELHAFCIYLKVRLMVTKSYSSSRVHVEFVGPEGFDNQDYCSQTGIRYVGDDASITSHKWSICICNYPKPRCRD